jgi:hypothetical protein
LNSLEWEGPVKDISVVFYPSAIFGGLETSSDLTGFSQELGVFPIEWGASWSYE